MHRRRQYTSDLDAVNASHDLLIGTMLIGDRLWVQLPLAWCLQRRLVASVDRMISVGRIIGFRQGVLQQPPLPIARKRNGRVTPGIRREHGSGSPSTVKTGTRSA